MAVQRLGNKAFPNASAYALRKEALEMPMPYCLCHKTDLRTSLLETKHCIEKDCSHLVFVKEVWTAPYQNEEATISRDQWRLEGDT